MRTNFTLAVILSIAVSLIGCSFNPLTKQKATVPSPSDEAYLLAQWLTGELHTAQPLANQITSDLKIIRSEFEDAVPASSIRFVPLHTVGELRIGFTEEGWINYNAGNYIYWDSLNTAWQVDKITSSGNDLFKSVTLEFKGLTNVDSLISYYTALPDLEFVEGNYLCCDWPIMLAVQSEDGLHYFFRNAWGDCLAGCINSEIHYFTIENSHARYRGSYLNDWENPTEPPAWYEMAVSVLAQYRQY